MMNENMDMELDVLELTEEDMALVDGGKKISVYVNGDRVNVRSGPGKNYQSIALMMDGDELVYLGEKKKDKKGKTWIKVICIDMVGWVRADLVRKHY